MNELDPTLIVAIPIIIVGYGMAAFGFWFANSPRSRQKPPHEVQS